MKGIFHPFDDVSQLDWHDIKKAVARGEPAPPPTGKPSSMYSESEWAAVRLRHEREKRRMEEEELVAAALKQLAKNPQRDHVIKEAVTAIQDAAVPTIVKIDETLIIIGESEEPRQDVKGILEERLAESKKSGKPPWLSILWRSLLESSAITISLEVGLPPIKVSASIDLILFFKHISKRRQGIAT
ncbi:MULTISPECIES: hypothetical protein [unclassified Sinorhizobium]|uniref:hypothetical protein n=1 Tax=unclassified Sinorhizobium TaxID=2613772 RepID=UPI0024C3D159|nr:MULTISPECIES: hypothetical protein [unclassified Sinorhizobium]MDK1376422.1 hypothetical protein [Sinorhizobium sp. 6-70]MDK1479971.1 hypothetical protein [Sinorhizobium sp. 6-117]